MVFDFVYNASQYNTPYSLHRLFKLNEYRPGKLALAPAQHRAAEDGLYARGERPEALIDYPVDATDYELVDPFNWQEEAAGMISQMEFVRRVSVQAETIERYINEGLLIPDLVVPMSEHRSFKYFKESTLFSAAKNYSWTIVDDTNRKDVFMDMIRRMDMSYSYKPILIMAILEYADSDGRVNLADIVSYFRRYFDVRRKAGLIVEKQNSIYLRANLSDQEIRTNILTYPYKRFEYMKMLRHTKTLGIIEVNSSVWRRLSSDEKAEIKQISLQKLNQYFRKLNT